MDLYQMEGIAQNADEKVGGSNPILFRVGGVGWWWLGMISLHV